MPPRRRRPSSDSESGSGSEGEGSGSGSGSGAGAGSRARALIDADAAPSLVKYREFLADHAVAAATRMATTEPDWTTTTRDARTGKQLPARVTPPAYDAYVEARAARASAFQAALSALSAAEYRAAVTGQTQDRGAVVEAATVAADAARALWAVERWRVNRVLDAPDAARAELGARLDALTAEAAKGPAERVRVADARRKVRAAMTEGAIARPLPDACLALVARAPDVETGVDAAAQKGGATTSKPAAAAIVSSAARLKRALGTDATLARLMGELRRRRGV